MGIQLHRVVLTSLDSRPCPRAARQGTRALATSGVTCLARWHLCQIPPGTAREEPENPWNSLPRASAQTQCRYEFTLLVFSMVRIQQLWGSCFGKSNNQCWPKGCQMSLSPHQHELSFRNAPSLGALPGTSQPQSGSSSTLDVQPSGTTPRHLHCLPPVSGFSAFLLSFWIPSAVLGSLSLSPHEVSLWGLLSFFPLEKGAPSHSFHPEELPTGSEVSMIPMVPEGMWLLPLVCQCPDNPSNPSPCPGSWAKARGKGTAVLAPRWPLPSSSPLFLHPPQ